MSQYRRVVVAALAAGCQHDVKTEFPPGLTPLEDDTIAAQASGPYSETLQTATDDAGYIHVYGRGYVFADPATVWAMIKNPTVVIAVCTTDSQTITPNDEPQYEFSFLVDYMVNEVVTVEWHDAWRYATIDGTPQAPELAIIKHQKTDGSSFITLSEGTIELAPTPDQPEVTDVAFVEHLDATEASDADVVKAMNHTFAAILAVSHGTAIPPCP